MSKALDYLREQRDFAGRVCKNQHSFSPEVFAKAKRDYPAIKEAYDAQKFIENFGGASALIKYAETGMKAMKPSLFDEPIEINAQTDPTQPILSMLQQTLRDFQDTHATLPTHKRGSSYEMTLNTRVLQLQEIIQSIQNKEFTHYNAEATASDVAA